MKAKKTAKSEEYPSGEKLVSNDVFIEWANEIFNQDNCPGPRKFYVYSEEVRQMLIDMYGLPPENITVLKFT